METKDLILRNWQDSDAKALYEMCLDEAIRKSGIDFYNSITDSQNTIQCWKNDKGFKVIADKRNDNFIGFISLGGMNRYDGYMEIEYAVAARYRNNGYAMQAVQRIIVNRISNHVSLVMTIQILRYRSQNKTLPSFLFFTII